MWDSQSDDHRKNNLAKFGCIIDMKVEKKTKSFYNLGYLLEVIIRLSQFGKNIIQKSGKFGPLFPWKFLCICQNHIFRSKFGKNSPLKETLHHWSPLDGVWTFRSTILCIKVPNPFFCGEFLTFSSKSNWTLM